MATTHIRKQGGAAVMTIPAHILKNMNVAIGATLELAIGEDGALTARPASPPRRKHYTMKELLRGVTPRKIARLHRETAAARGGGAVGRELT